MSNTYNKKIKEKYNPFEFSNLKERLLSIPNEQINYLKRNLLEQISHYVFEINYEEEKRNRDYSNHNLKILNFQNKYPNSKEKQMDKYYSEIAKLINLFEGN